MPTEPDTGYDPELGRKFVFVTGGVMSGLGKGITAASTGRLLANAGFDVTAVKIDPYLNVDAGTMNPYQHGEVYVLKDGGEVDLDLGNYERFLGTDMTSDHNVTTGKVYKHVIEKERAGDYLGKTVQIIPHVTDDIKRRVREAAAGSDVCIVEVGGTVGDIEGMPYLEALRQFAHEQDEEDILFAHVTLVPYSKNGEQKTKPTQHSVKELRSIGLTPDAIAANKRRARERQADIARRAEKRRAAKQGDKQWTDEDLKAVARMKEQGLKVKEIAARMGVTVGSITGAWSRYQNAKET